MKNVNFNKRKNHRRRSWRFALFINVDA